MPSHNKRWYCRVKFLMRWYLPLMPCAREPLWWPPYLTSRENVLTLQKEIPTQVSETIQSPSNASLLTTALGYIRPELRSDSLLLSSKMCLENGRADSQQWAPLVREAALLGRRFRRSLISPTVRHQATSEATWGCKDPALHLKHYLPSPPLT